MKFATTHTALSTSPKACCNLGKLKIQIFCRCGRKRNQIALFIHKFYYFPILIANKIFHVTVPLVIMTFCVSRRRRKMCCGHALLCVCVCVCVSVGLSVCLSVCLSAAVRPHYCTDPDVTWRRGRGCPLVVHYWADLQSGHGCVAMAT